MKIILTICIIVFQALIYFIPQEKVFNNNNSLLNKLNKHGWRIIVCCGLTGIATLWLLYISNEESNDFTHKIEKRDSLIEKNRKDDAENYITKLKENANETRNALLKYGFEIDSSNMELKKIIESSKDTISKNPDPILSLTKIKMKDYSNNEVHFSITFHSYDATTYNPEIITNIIIRDPQEILHYMPVKYKGLENYLKISKDKDLTSNIILWNASVDPIEYYFYIKGYYRKSKNGKKIYINDVFSYKISDSTTSQATFRQNKEIKEFMTSIKNKK